MLGGQPVRRAREQQGEDRDLHGGADQLSGGEGQGPLRAARQIAPRVGKAEAVGGRGAEAQQVARERGAAEAAPHAEHRQHADKAHAEAGEPARGGVLVGEPGDRDRQREQRNGGVPDPGQHARDVALAVGEQRERSDVQEHPGDRQLGPHAAARGQPFAAQREDRQQRRGPHEQPAERDLERRERLVADLDEQERRAPEQREQREPRRPGDCAAIHPTIGNERWFERRVSVRCMVEVTSS